MAPNWHFFYSRETCTIAGSYQWLRRLCVASGFLSGWYQYGKR